MIKNDLQLELTRNYLKKMEEIVARLSKRKMHPKRRRIWLEPYLVEIHKAENAIKEYVKVNEAERARAAISLRFIGPSITDGAIPARFLSRFTNDFQSLVNQIAKSILKIDFEKKRDSREVEIEKACRLLVVNIEYGSFSLGFEFDIAFLQQDLFAKPIPIQSLEHIIEIASRIASKNAEKLDDVVPDDKYRNDILKKIRRLVPSRTLGLDKMELLPRYKKTIQFDQEAYKYIGQLIKLPDQEVCEVIGTIMGVDFQYKKFKLIDPDERIIQCKYDDEEMDDKIITGLKHIVRITGTAYKDLSTGRVKSIEDVTEIFIEGEDKTIQTKLFEKS